MDAAQHAVIGRRLAALVLGIALAGCMASRPPHMMSPYYKVVPGQSDTLGGDAWLIDPEPGDTYAVAGEDLLWRDEALIGPADDRTGRCSVDAKGTIAFKAPKTPGEWPCLLRACRETCWVARVTLVVEPAR